MDAVAHRNFLADFYNGSFPGSFARGADFQSNPETGDRRTNGSFAALAGLESALEQGDPALIDAAVARILLGHALIAGFGGIPLIYMGDEIGLMNDHSYLDDPARRDDGRWMHRPRMDWDLVARLGQGGPAARIHAGTKAILATRRATPELAAHVPTRILDLGHRALFAFQRAADGRTVTGLCNFADVPAQVTPWALQLDPAHAYGDLLSGAPLVVSHGTVAVPPLTALWLAPRA
jgi:amylosucrase